MGRLLLHLTVFPRKEALRKETEVMLEMQAIDQSEMEHVEGGELISAAIAVGAALGPVGWAAVVVGCFALAAYHLSGK